jgi:hypothetical protein
MCWYESTNGIASACQTSVIVLYATPLASSHFSAELNLRQDSESLNVSSTLGRLELLNLESEDEKGNY